jgi:hypothetical protein
LKITKPVFYGSPNSHFAFMISDLHKTLGDLYEKVYEALNANNLLDKENAILIRSLVNTHNGKSFSKRMVKDIYNTFISFVSYKNNVNDSSIDLEDAALVYCKQIYDRIKQLESIIDILNNGDFDSKRKLEEISLKLKNHPL